MGSKKINRENQTKSDSVLNANALAKAWLNTLNPFSMYTGDSSYQKAISGKTSAKEQTQAPAPVSNYTVNGVLYDGPSGRPYNSPKGGYSIDEYGRPIAHTSQTPGLSIRPKQSSALMEPDQPPIAPLQTTVSPQSTVEPIQIGRDDPFAPLDSPEPATAAPASAEPALSRAATWASIRKIPVTDSNVYMSYADGDKDLADTNSYGSVMTGPDGETIPIEAEKWDESQGAMVDIKQDWSKAKAKAASATAFLNAEPGQGAIGPLAAAEAAVGVSRGGDSKGSFLNLQRDGKTYQIRGTQQDMASAAAKARAGKNIFGDFDFKELPQTDTETLVKGE